MFYKYKYSNFSSKNKLARLLVRHRVKAVDMNEPHLWYPQARYPRRIICHVGPTNSGKTYNALKSLENSYSGLYCGPLRLLAWEVCEKLRGLGIKCNLITGQEKENIDQATHISCTIEMADLYKSYDCAVLDESQLIGDVYRGWAWTQALLGLQVKEIHLCGNYGNNFMHHNFISLISS